MSLSARTLHPNSFVLKLLALICGYGLWNVVSIHQKITLTRQIPVCFYNVSKNLTLTAPETISVSCFGTRKDLFKTAFEGSMHVDARTLHEGIHTLALSKEQIFLPESVRLLHYLPTHITVQVAEKKQAS